MSYALPPLNWGYMVLAAADVNPLGDWYCRVLGFSVEAQGFMPGADAEYVVLGRHGMKLEICRRPGAGAVARPTPPPPHHLDQTGWKVFTLRCPDLAGLGDWLEEQAADLVWSAHSLAPGICSTLLRDPEGNLINIFGPEPAA